jgi:hypothetical protein
MAGPMGEGGVRYWVVRSVWVGVDGEGGGIETVNTEHSESLKSRILEVVPSRM